MESTASLPKILLMFYLLLASGNINNLYSGQLSTYIEENRYIQHVIGLITMMVLIMSVGNHREPSKVIALSIIGYLWFLMTTKLDIEWNIAIIIILAFGYLYEHKLNYEVSDISKDFILDDDEKDKLTNRKRNMLYLFGGLILVITFIGTASYYGRKKMEYKQDFDGITFFLMPGKKSMKRYILRD